MSVLAIVGSFVAGGWFGMTIMAVLAASREGDSKIQEGEGRGGSSVL